MLEVLDVRKTFNPGTSNEVRALRGVSLTLEEGSFTIVIGTNGSGKSTLLNAVAGSFPVDAGRLRIGGTDVTRWPEYRRARLVGRVFQNPFSGTAPNLSIAENFSLAARRGLGRGLGWAVARRLRAEMKDAVRQLNMGLEERLDNVIGSLSGGQRQALTLLMSTWRKPHLLLLDEHTAALDPKSADQVIALTEKIVARGRLTTLMVTHSMQQAAALGDRLIMMHRGNVLHDIAGAEKRRIRPAELLERFEEVRRAELLDESAAAMLERLYAELVRRLWLGVLLIALTSGFLLLSDYRQRQAGPGAVPRVALFKYSSIKLLDDVAKGALDRLRANGFTPGRNILVDEFNAENDMATANSIARELVAGKYKYVITVSTNCLQVVANANREGHVIQIFGGVADPIIAKVGIGPNGPLDHPKHLVGVGSLMAAGELLELARRVYPGVQRFGLPWNPSQANSERYTGLARVTAKKIGVDLLEASVDNTAAVGETVGSLISRGAQVITVLGDLTVSLGIDAAVAEARKGGVPVIALHPDLVNHGALFAMGLDYYRVGEQVGDMTARVLQGEDTARMPILYDVPRQIGVNLKAAAGLRERWVLPPDLISKAAIVVR